MKVVPIVEGHGEVQAVPVLLRRVAQWRTPGSVAEVVPPIRVRKDRFLNRDAEFQRYLQLAATKCGDDGWILILLDADDECPAEIAPEILRRVKACTAHRPVSIVLAKREYEAWFIAAASSLDGRRAFSLSATVAIDAETPRDAKGWIGARIAGRAYSEITDQPAFSALMDLQQTFDGSRSFRKLCAEWDRRAAQA